MADSAVVPGAHGEVVRITFGGQVICAPRPRADDASDACPEDIFAFQFANKPQ
jgi:hypothetical protein